MSRKSRSEYIGEKRRVYATAKPEKRSRILDEDCETLGCGRKYVNKLLMGNVRCRERRGRDSFFWTLTQTNRNTQRTEITTTWNRGISTEPQASRVAIARYNGNRLS